MSHTIMLCHFASVLLGQTYKLICPKQQHRPTMRFIHTNILIPIILTKLEQILRCLNRSLGNFHELHNIAFQPRFFFKSAIPFVEFAKVTGLIVI